MITDHTSMFSWIWRRYHFCKICIYIPGTRNWNNRFLLSSSFWFWSVEWWAGSKVLGIRKIERRDFPHAISTKHNGLLNKVRKKQTTDAISILMKHKAYMKVWNDNWYIFSSISFGTYLLVFSAKFKNSDNMASRFFIILLFCKRRWSSSNLTVSLSLPSFTYKKNK